MQASSEFVELEVDSEANMMTTRGLAIEDG